MELISPEDYAFLPADPAEKFVAFEEICRRNMNTAITHETPEHFDRMLRMQYMSLVSAAAEECGVEGLKFPWNLDHPEEGFQYFLLEAAGITTRFRLRASGRADAFSVRLASKTRGRIEQQIAKLRDAINSSDLPEDRCRALLAKLDELSIELSQPRVRFGKVLAILGVVGAGLMGATGFLADAPQAVATITSLLGADKIAEDAETERLGAPAEPKKLPAKPVALPAPTGDRRKFELDDEIPF